MSDDPVSSCLFGQGGGAERGEWGGEGGVGRRGKLFKIQLYCGEDCT